MLVSASSCVRVCALGIYIYEELSHGTMHSKIRDAVEAILDSVKVSLRVVCHIFVYSIESSIWITSG